MLEVQLVALGDFLAVGPAVRSRLKELKVSPNPCFKAGLLHDNSRIEKLNVRDNYCSSTVAALGYSQCIRRHNLHNSEICYFREEA